VEFEVLTLHPEMIVGPIDGSIIGRARKAGLLRVGVHDIRDHGVGRHKQVDDTPYGGGAGMVMQVDVVVAAIEAVRREGSHVILTSPGGQTFDQAKAEEISNREHVVIICGHYEGVDARVADWVDEEISIGDFVLTGGELPALVMIDASARLIPGVLGNENSAVEESFSEGLLEHPQFTRPREFRGLSVPPVLLSGNHGKIAEWRRQRAVEKTELVRPDLIAEPPITERS
jgi:tRNA (guanine37-N1)-methyltransferase